MPHELGRHRGDAAAPPAERWEGLNPSPRIPREESPARFCYRRTIVRIRRRSTQGARAASLGLALSIASSVAHAQDGGATDGGSPVVDRGGCPTGALGCASSPIEFRRREGLPVELDVDTGWVPASAPVQVRFRAALVGHTEVRAGGTLVASWPRAFEVRTPPGAPGSGVLASDYGLVFSTRVRLHLDVGGSFRDWEGAVPFVPQVDFRATGRGNFDPWAFERVSVRGMTARQRIADVPLTDALIPIPGISGGLTFEATAALETGYRSTRISFPSPADAITATVDRVMVPFGGGPVAELLPRLEGVVDQRIDLTITPALYVSLLGRRWTLPVVDIPLPLPTPTRPWLFDPQRVSLDLPDLAPIMGVLDFGDVPVGETAARTIQLDNRGGLPLSLARSTDLDSAPFAWSDARIEIPARGFRAVEMRFAPTREGGFDTRVPLLTGDPDSPTVYVTARGRGVIARAIDAGADATIDASLPRDAATDARIADGGPIAVRQEGGCGCAIPGAPRAPSPTAWSALALLAAWRRRRRG
jgi:MYXO-CTERM domain-containing protein